MLKKAFWPQEEMTANSSGKQQLSEIMKVQTDKNCDKSNSFSLPNQKILN